MIHEDRIREALTASEELFRFRPIPPSKPSSLNRALRVIVAVGAFTAAVAALVQWPLLEASQNPGVSNDPNVAVSSDPPVTVQNTTSPSITGPTGADEPLGPSAGLAFMTCCDSEADVVVDGTLISASGTRSGDITAQDADSLESKWGVSVGDESYLLGSWADWLLASQGVQSLVILDVVTGETIWKVPINPQHGVVASRQPPESPMVYVATADGTDLTDAPPQVMAVNLEQKTVRWTASARAGAELQWAPPVVDSEVVVVMTVPPRGGTAELVAFNLADGSVAWVTNLHDTQRSYSDRLMVGDPNRHYLIAVTPSGIVYSVDPADGTVRWSHDVGFFTVIQQLTDETVVLERDGSKLDLETGKPVG